MTDEEIKVQAEIYTKEKHCKSGCKNIPICWENDIEDCCTDCIKTNEDFIAGVKWGMEHAIEWHDLRKNPEDLPKIKGDYLCCIPYYDSNNTFYGVVNFDEYSKKFYLDEGGEPFNVIAWCEFSQFKDKEQI